MPLLSVRFYVKCELETQLFGGSQEGISIDVRGKWTTRVGRGRILLSTNVWATDDLSHDDNRPGPVHSLRTFEGSSAETKYTVDFDVAIR